MLRILCLQIILQGTVLPALQSLTPLPLPLFRILHPPNHFVFVVSCLSNDAAFVGMAASRQTGAPGEQRLCGNLAVTLHSAGS